MSCKATLRPRLDTLGTLSKVRLGHTGNVPVVTDVFFQKRDRFASHAELVSRGLLGADGALRVRATVTVGSSSCEIAAADADACLLSAARSGAADAVRRCLRAGADARHRDTASGSQRTPLHLACARGHRADADSAAAAIVPVLAAARAPAPDLGQ